MYIISFISLLAVFLTMLDSNNMLKSGFKLGMGLVSFFAAIRYNFGNDYMSYIDDFNDAAKYSFSELVLLQEEMKWVNPIFKDIGAAFLYKLFNPFSFFTFSAFVCIIEGLIYYQFIRENVERHKWWLAMTIYLFQFDFFIIPMSAIRQGLTVALFVWSWHFIKRKNIIAPLIISIISITIHKSAMITLPFVFIGFLPIKRHKICAACMILVMTIFLISTKLLGNIYQNVANFDLVSIYDQAYGDESVQAFGIIKKSIASVPFLLALYYIWMGKGRTDERQLVLLSTIGSYVLCFSFVVMLVFRLAYYFNIFMIASVPLTASSIKSQIIRKTIISFFLSCNIYQYFDLFLNSVYSNSIADYHTIFSVLFK